MNINSKKDVCPNKAVVLGLGVNGLGVARSLGKNGVQVVGFYQSKDTEIARLSKYVKSIKYVSKDELLHKLLMLGREQSKSVLFCTSDKYIQFVLDNKEKLEKLFCYNWTEVDLYRKIIDKGKYLALIELLNIPHPKTITFFEGGIDLENKINSLQCPCIVKPIIAEKNPIIGFEKNRIIYTKEELVRFVKINSKNLASILIQEIIQHDDNDILYCTGYVDHQGVLKALFSVQKIRQYLPGYGVTSFAVSKKNNEVEKLSRRALNNIGFKGLFDIEFVYDNKNEQYQYIEINPRTHLANSHSTDCGINLPIIAYNDFIGVSNCSEKASNQTENVYWLNFDNDIGSFYRRREDGDIVFIQWLLSILRVRSFAVFDRVDLLPFFFSSWLFLLKALFRVIGR
ncbi:MAG TPA: hypothetical protein EYP35_07225 [Desulfobacterales bacterium]|nr:hypothetical protein [Desulfobacterales bacterium]HIP39396.1 hypothetical protein [Desulfocapsa sulfexigens]